MQYCSDRNYGCRILEYTFNEYTNIKMENDLIQINILVDKGTDITQIQYKPFDMDFMWQNPYGMAGNHSKNIPSFSNPIGSNLDYYLGGWHEAFPGGGPYKDMSAMMGIHGEVALKQWGFRVLEDTEEKISIQFYTHTTRTPYELEKTIVMYKGSSDICFEERITNLSNQDMDYMWGQHPAIGKPFLDENCTIEIPSDYFIVDKDFNSADSLFEPEMKYSWPLSSGKDEKLHDMSKITKGPSAELLFFPKIKEGKCIIINHKKKLGIAFEWDKSVFDTIWYWRMLKGISSYPWYGRAYCVGLEFWNGYPNFDEAKRNGTIKTLAANSSITTTYKCSVFTI